MEMKAEFQRGKVKYTIESTDGTFTQNDVVTVISNCTMSVDGFEELFFRFVNSSATYTEAYERAERVHENLLGARRYSDYDSFRKVKEKRHR